MPFLPPEFRKERGRPPVDVCRKTEIVRVKANANTLANILDNQYIFESKMHTILVLPFGLLIIYFFVSFVFFHKAKEGAEKHVGSKIRQGITEYPHLISLFLIQSEKNKIEFSGDGKSVILTIELWDIVLEDMNIGDASSVKNHIEEYLKKLGSENVRNHPDDDFHQYLFGHYIVNNITLDTQTGCHHLTVTLPDEVVCGAEYIEHEIRNLGSVLTVNSSNHARWFTGTQGERRFFKRDGRMLVYIDRKQVVPGFIDTKSIIMSERQITRNIKNRLWNRVDVRCISIDENTYCGEIIHCRANFV